MTQKEKTTPATPSGAYFRMKQRWDLAEAVLGGTDTMRVAGKTYLPQHEQETNDTYNTRLSTAVLVNITEMTLEALVGRPFSKPIALGDDVSSTITEYCEDIDLQGNNLQSFGRSWFREGWGKGLSHVLVDFPIVAQSVDSTGNPVPRTLEDDRRENLRPFCSRIRPDSVIAAFAETINGQERLTHVRIMESSIEQDGWGETLVQRVRVLEPGTWATYVPTEVKNEWRLEDSGFTPLDVIPLVTFYAGKREGLHECKPPLHDLMHLNVAHWQSASDQRNVLTVARFPILAGKGVSSTDTVAIGPNRYLTTETAEGEWYYVEHTGAAIAAGASDLKDLEDKMAAYGAEFLKRRPGSETATARALDSAEGMSYLQATSLDFQDAVERVLQLMGMWIGETKEVSGSVTVHTEFASGEAAAGDLETLLKLRATKDISRIALLGEFQRRGVLSDDFDAEEDATLLEEEREEMPGMDNMFNANGTPKTKPLVELDPATGLPIEAPDPTPTEEDSDQED